MSRKPLRLPATDSRRSIISCETSCVTGVDDGESFLEEDSMALIQFLRLRRGVSEVVHTVDFAGNASAALAEGARLVRRGRWPARADGLRAVDDCGRTLMKWDIAVDVDRPTSILLTAA
jgi:hypothetical protein